MKIEKLIDYLDDCIVDKVIMTDEFDYSKGLSVLMLNSGKISDAKFFVGSYNAFISCVNRNEFIEGATYLICSDVANQRPIYSGPVKINVILTNTLLDALIRKVESGILAEFEAKSKDMTRICMDFWNDLTEGLLCKYDDALERFNKLFYPVKRHIAVIIIRYDNDHISDTEFGKISNAISDFFPNTNYWFNGREWIVLFSQDRESSEDIDISYEAFHDMLKANSLRASISYVFQHPEIIEMAYKATGTAFAVGLKMNVRTNVNRVYTFKELNPYLIVHMAAQRYRGFFNSNNLMYMAHPDVVTLYYHDIEEKDDLLEVLDAYLAAGGSIAIASKNLYMHRNTVQNKIRKIREMIHLDIDNGNDMLLLRMSIIIVKYQEQYLKKSITDFF